MKLRLGQTLKKKKKTFVIFFSVDGQEIKVEVAHGRGSTKPRGGGGGSRGYGDRRGGYGGGFDGGDRRGGGGGGRYGNPREEGRGGGRYGGDRDGGYRSVNQGSIS